MQDDLLAEGLELMLVGMGTVFVFLTTLVGATSLMSKLVMGKTTGTAPGDGPSGAGPSGDGPSDEELAAIGAAIARHRLK